MKKIVLFVSIIMLVLIIAPVSYVMSAEWYNAYVYKMNCYNNGTIVVQFVPSEGEMRFEDNIARVRLQSDWAGANRMMAVLLSAMNAGWRVQINLDYPPSWTNQDLLSISLVDPGITP